MVTPPNLRYHVHSKKLLAQHHTSPQQQLEQYDPNPDWSLQDLQKELDAISSKLNTSSPTLATDVSPPTTGSRFSWRELSVAADFGRTRRPFRVSAIDSDSETDSDIEEGNAQGKTDRQHEDLQVDKNAKHKKKVEDSENKSTLASVSVIEGGPWLLPKTEVTEGLMFELERERLQRVQEEIRQRRFQLEIAIEEESMRSAAIFEQVEKEEESKREYARRIDKQYQRSIAEMRDSHLSALQREHEQRSQVEERRLRKEAEAKKREELAREERERQEKLKAEAEVKRKAEERQAAEAERRRQAEAAAAAALQRAEAEKQVKESAAQAKPEIVKTEGPKPLVAESAAILERNRITKMTVILEQSLSVQMNPSFKKALKDHEKSIAKLVQQVTATQDQVRIKSSNLIQELTSSPYKAFCIETFAKKVVSQCENQVSKLPSYAFALAQVVVNISSFIPEVMDMVILKLNEVCILTVPKYYVYKKSQFRDVREYHKALKYNEVEGSIESTDDFVARMNAYVTLYAAIVQAEVDGGSHPHGLKEGWAWCARLLNSLPPDQLTGSALLSFIEVAGYRLHKAYQKSFLKILHVIASEYVVPLRNQNLGSVATRFEIYLDNKKYLQEPNGRRMPKTDVSASLCRV